MRNRGMPNKEFIVECGDGSYYVNLTKRDIEIIRLFCFGNDDPFCHSQEDTMWFDADKKTLREIRDAQDKMTEALRIAKNK